MIAPTHIDQTPPPGPDADAVEGATAALVHAYKRTFGEDPGEEARCVIDSAAPVVAEGARFEWSGEGYVRELELTNTDEP